MQSIDVVHSETLLARSRKSSARRKLNNHARQHSWCKRTRTDPSDSPRARRSAAVCLMDL